MKYSAHSMNITVNSRQFIWDKNSWCFLNGLQNVLTVLSFLSGLGLDACSCCLDNARSICVYKNCGYKISVTHRTKTSIQYSVRL